MRIKFTASHINDKPEHIATRLCDMIYGAGGRCVPDPAPEAGNGWMVGMNNDVWLREGEEPGEYSLDFRYSQQPEFLEAFCKVLRWRGVAVHATIPERAAA